MGDKFDVGKPRLDLIRPFPELKLAEVLTIGAEKYSDYNWCKGIQWSKIIGSYKRHLNSFEDGIDFDSETGLLHLQHAYANIHFLLEYYKTCPHLDDRLAKKSQYNVGLYLPLRNLDFLCVPKYRNVTQLDDVLVATLLDLDINLVITSDYEEYLYIRNQEILVFLFTSPENERFEVGYRRINNVEELKAFL